jgi:RNA-binding protein YlmH
LRLDAIVAEAMRIPRPDAVSLAAQGRVLVNYQPCLKNDAHLNAGDVISIRGMGRVILKETGGKSKKDRIYLTMEVFSRNQ